MAKKSENILAHYIEAISKIRVDRSHGIGPALKKPLLLLLLISKFGKGQMLENSISFSVIDSDLAELIEEFGGKPTPSGAKPEQPFYHLSNDGFWELHFPSDVSDSHRGGPNRTVLSRKDVFASLDSGLFELLKSSPEARAAVAASILGKWWPETIQHELREHLEISDGVWIPATDPGIRRRRDPEFREKVLANWRYRCAICGFSGVLNKKPFGLEAAHIRALQYEGPDTVENGIAMCRLHHLTFDKGVLGIDENLKVKISSYFVAQDDRSRALVEDFHEVMIGGHRAVPPALEQFEWHFKNVFWG